MLVMSDHSGNSIMLVLVVSDGQGTLGTGATALKMESENSFVWTVPISHDPLDPSGTLEYVRGALNDDLCRYVGE